MSSMSPQASVPTPYTPPGETFLEKAKRKTIEEPLVPVGALATALAVTMATRQFRRGNRTAMNHWLRVRVAAQGFTVLAICTYGFALRWRKQGQESGSDATTIMGTPSMFSGENRGSIAGNIQVTPAALLREAAKEKEKGEFEKRLEEAVLKDLLEQKENKQGEKEKVDWKAAWKEGILRKNKENDEKRTKRSDRID